MIMNDVANDVSARLIPLKEIIGKDLYNMYQNIPFEEVGSKNEMFGIGYDDFYIKCKQLIKEETMSNSRLQTTTIRYILLINGKLVGEAGIRTTLNNFWVNKGSQIYYKIRLDERNKGYGNIILKLTLIKAKNLGFKQVRINCDDNNIASKKIILNNGGVVDIKSYKTANGYSSSYIISL